MTARRTPVPLLLFAGLSLALLLGACSSATASRPLQVEPEKIESLRRFRKDYVLAPGDQIEVLVQRYPEVSRVVQIRADGRIALPLLGELQAAGLTFTELSASIAKALSPRLRDVEVNILSVDLRQPQVYVIGDVNRPAPVPLRQAGTAAQAIAAAGGFPRSAKSRRIALIRLNAEGYLVATPLEVTGRGQPSSWLALQATVLQPDDIIFIPENNRSQFTRFVTDFINTPLSGVNSVFTTYTNYRLTEALELQIDAAEAAAVAQP